ncbi:MAG: hypothetical protein ACKOZZ_06785 [Bacteroidota bacterium]
MRRFLSLFVFLVCFFNAGVNAQSVSFWAPKDSILANVDVYRADIQVSNFKFIVGTQFNVAWDSTLLSLDSVGNFGLPLKLDDHFGLVSKSKGVLSFQWFDESFKGITLLDKKVLFSLYFKVKGLRGLKSPITFVDTPTNIRETADSSYKAVTAFYVDGFVVLKMGATSSAPGIDPDQLRIEKVYPNPVSTGEVSVNWFSSIPGTVEYTLTDVKGSIIKKWLNRIGTGTQYLQIPVTDFPAKGYYNLQIKQGIFQSNQQIIYMPAN